MATIEIDDNLHHSLIALARQQGISLEALLARTVEDDRFLPGVVHLLSHDLRTPLATIMSSSDLIKHYHSRLTEERLEEHLDTIQMQVRYLDSYLDNLTLLFKLRMGLLDFDPQPQDLDGLCRSVIQRVADHSLLVPDIQFEVSSSAGQALGDSRLLRHAVTNLLTNALKFSAEGAAVGLKLSVEPHHSCIVVQDSGIGIPLEEQARLGEPFFRASNAMSLPGQGLGLVVVKQIVELHRGKLVVESALNEGTRVSITLPNPAG